MVDLNKNEVTKSMNRKISDMTPDEIRSYIRPLGLPEAPFPMVKLEKNSQGTLDQKVGLIASAQNPMRLYSESSIERVYGRMMRNMPTPSMMLILRDLISLMQPDSKGCLMTILGDPSAGKTFMFYEMAAIVHKQGAIKVDCGGMNMRELFFRTVIDYGKGIREQLDQKAEAGKMLQSSLDALEDAFPGSVIQKDGKTKIDWGAVGQRKTDAEGKCLEGYEEATNRARAVLEMIYTKEGISVQSNSFGIKTVKGEAFVAWECGRPLVLDEFNKCKRGTLDMMQTFLQFLNGEGGFDTVTIYNSMAQSNEHDSDSPKSITLSRGDRPLGWFVGIAGNDTSDGETTQELSQSMMTRLNARYVGAPTENDWKHRISQIYTGMPVTTLYTLFSEQAHEAPEKFSDWLVKIRLLDLTPEEVKEVPPHEISMLRNFADTVQAIEKLTTYYDTRAKLADPESALLQVKAYEACVDEISSYGNRIYASFRKVIADFNKAIESKPPVEDAGGNKLTFDISSVLKAFNVQALDDTQPGWHRLGANIARTIQEDIANDTVRMPNTQGALLRICEDAGIIQGSLSGGKPSPDFKYLSELLSFDPTVGLGNVEELKEIRGVLIAALKNKYGNIAASDEKVIPLASLSRALGTLEAGAETSFVVPNDNIDDITGEPLVEAVIASNYHYYDQPSDPFDSGEYQLADYRTALAGFAIPKLAEENIKRIWFQGLEPEGVDMALPENQEEFSYVDVLKGESRFGVGLSILEVSGQDGKSTFLQVLVDDRGVIVEGAERKALIVGTDEISPQLHGELSKQGITYVVQNEKLMAEKVDDFIKKGAEFRANNFSLDEKEAAQLADHYVSAYDALTNTSEDERVIAMNTKLSDMMSSFNASNRPGFCKRIGFKPKQLKM